MSKFCDKLRIRLLKNLAGLYFAYGSHFAKLCIWQIAMLAKNNMCIFTINSTDKFNDTEIAISYPQLPLFDCRQHLIQQGALLCVAIFTGKDIYGTLIQGHKRPAIFPAVHRLKTIVIPRYDTRWPRYSCRQGV